MNLCLHITPLSQFAELGTALMSCSSCVRQKLPKVNKELALKLMEEGDDEADLTLRKKKGKVRNFSSSFILVFLCPFGDDVGRITTASSP